MTMPSQLPVVCRLTDGEFGERRKVILATLTPAIIETQEQADGFCYRFAAHDETLESLCEIVNLERKCCPFLRFRITAEPGDGDLLLEVTGPDGTKEFLSTSSPDYGFVGDEETEGTTTVSSPDNSGSGAGPARCSLSSV